jgi:hypothetical protein
MNGRYLERTAKTKFLCRNKARGDYENPKLGYS